MSAEEEQKALRQLRRYGQGHLVRMAERLEPGRRLELLRDLAGLDYARIEEFRGLIDTPPTDISFADVAPPHVERLPLTEGQQRAERRVARVGRRALKAGRVAVLTVAGGHGTRLGYDHPKGTYGISPVRRRSFFALLAEQILAARRRYSCKMPWFVMTGPTVDAETRSHFEQNEYFGLGEDTVRFFCQGTNPILDDDGRLLLTPEGRLLCGPDGHGGVFEALKKGELTDVLRHEGCDLISYCQVDNPLVTVTDARFIGHHLLKSAEFSCKVVPKRDPNEGLGLAVLKGYRAAIVEYFDVPQDAADARAPSGKLRFTYGSIAIHILSVPFVERLIEEGDVLPWHIARRQYKVMGEDGQPTLSAPAGCCKFERFVFDALPFAEECAFVEVRRDTEFGPVKAAEGEDSPATARRLMQRAWLQWLRAAGASFSAPSDLSEPVIEISPLFASDAEELKERLEPGFEPSFPLVLEP